ncbi:MAG: heparinase II/III family protein [Pseudomonadota bacterium]
MRMSALFAGACLSFVVGCTTQSAPAQEQGDGVDLSLAEPQQTGFDAVMENLAAQVDARLAHGIPVPVPRDAGGGYTHEQHKQNAKTIYEAGLLFQYGGAPKYRDAVRDILFDYADLYPTLGIHPEQRSSNKGKLFWQGLNEAWWLVYVIQGYEVVRNDLSEAGRARIESGVIEPMADFLSTGSPQTFDRIHNHATWATTAVGMTGYVLGQPERVQQALYGLDKSGEAGFLKQLDELFSPDGYYAEGPYYQRYALMPFVLFSQAIDRNEPEREIFEHRDGIVLKAIRSTLEQSYAGRFFPINDAIREKGINTVELKYGLAIAYERTGDADLLGAIQLQNGVVPTPGGQAALEAITAGKAKPFVFTSKQFRDGPQGDQGALVVLRSGPDSDSAAVVMKATTQGLGHGHHDKLGLLYYDNGDEIVADYGAARFLNVEAKNGGRYLPENETWAKQTVAHNALVVDQTSHFGGNWREAQKHAPTVIEFGDRDGIQVAFAEISTAYDDVHLQRMIAIMPGANGREYIIDLMRGLGTGTQDATRTFDLPVHFKGQLIETSFGMTHATNRLEPLGDQNGYQHLWRRSESEPLNGVQNASWLLGDQFYTLTFASDQSVSAYFTELGANDPNHNLRHEQALMLRTSGHSVNYVSIYERHGRYDSDEEVTVFDGSSIEDIEITNENEITSVTITPIEGDAVTFRLAASGATRAPLQIERHNSPDTITEQPGEGSQ